MSTGSIVKLEDGSYYEPVWIRKKKHREERPEEIIYFPPPIFRDDNTVLQECQIWNASRTLLLANGYAEERRDLNEINRTSAVEVAQTSALGRALYARGYGNGEIATAEEVEAAKRAYGALKQLEEPLPVREPGGTVAEPDQAVVEHVPQSLRDMPGMVFERHGAVILARGTSVQAVTAARNLLSAAGFRENVWIKRADPATEGLPDNLPTLKDCSYVRHGNVVLINGNAYQYREGLKASGWELWWVKRIVERPENRETGK